MTPDLVHVLVVGAAVFACGGYLAGRHPANAMTAVALMLGGAGIDLVGMARFASVSGGSATGQELAALAAGVALAAAALGAGLARAESAS